MTKGDGDMLIKRQRPWVAQQNWEDILFIHTPIQVDTLRSVVPYPFEIDTYHGKGWISIVFFRARHSRLRLMPTFLSLQQFCQMNIRTYVRFGNERGVYFFSMHVNNRMVKVGGSIAGLPFEKAHMTMQKEAGRLLVSVDELFDYPQRNFRVTYAPKSDTINLSANSLPHFLSERYAIWMIKGQTIVKAPIYHTHWDLKSVDVSVDACEHMPFSMTNDTVAHYAHFKHALIYPFEKVGKVSFGMA